MFFSWQGKTQQLLRWRTEMANVRALRGRDLHEASKVFRMRRSHSDEPSAVDVERRRLCASRLAERWQAGVAISEETCRDE